MSATSADFPNACNYEMNTTAPPPFTALKLHVLDIMGLLCVPGLVFEASSRQFSGNIV